MQTDQDCAQFEIHRGAEGRVELELSGRWTMQSRLPDRELLAAICQPEVRQLAYRTRDLEAWDSILITLLRRIERACGARGVAVDRSGLLESIRRMLQMAEAVPERQGARREDKKNPFVINVGEQTLDLGQRSLDTLAFLGDTTRSIGRFFTGRARFRRRDLLLYIQESGANAFPIVTLISLLVGLILAFVGAVQLQMFGAEIFIANAVGLGMARDMGAMMTGIIMAGRTGAAFAAQLGTMQVNEEIDALRTLGISPIDFLVLPRILALTLMLPLLTIYADLMGIIGGSFVGVFLFDITPMQYFIQTRDSVALNHFWVGLAKSGVYGVIVALAGCLRGMQCGRSAMAVGGAATSAVVTGIVWIVVSCAILTVMFHMLGI